MSAADVMLHDELLNQLNSPESLQEMWHDVDACHYQRELPPPPPYPGTVSSPGYSTGTPSPYSQHCPTSPGSHFGDESPYSLHCPTPPTADTTSDDTIDGLLDLDFILNHMMGQAEPSFYADDVSVKREAGAACCSTTAPGQSPVRPTDPPGYLPDFQSAFVDIPDIKLEDGFACEPAMRWRHQPEPLPRQLVPPAFPSNSSSSAT
ncbi:PREDICTED: formin-like protein 20 [Priapulus caudatus]|uniref:Formin-like protein 20 n=1 Tax=Priapulus caudatus TaxID=37621 RepID=A0ABM1EPM7_PRICU|nr:PREDICTED: formin-like protein 20 [Priapulus caudatus]